MLNKIYIFCISLVCCFSCQTTDNKTDPFAGIPSPESNPISIEGVEFGKILFSDSRLSSNEKMSCASCHHPDSFFISASKQAAFSKIGRNVSPLYNLAWSKLFFWDGSEENLESLIIKPIANPDEMHGDLSLVVSKLNQDKTLRSYCKSAFGIDTIYTALVSRAISQYIRTLVKPRPLIDPKDSLALAGEQIFDRFCSSCHSGKQTSDFDLRRSPVNAMGEDSGRYQITHNQNDVYFFKTPSLANVSKTAPYTHNGRYQYLESIVKEYAILLSDSELKSIENQEKLIRFLEKL